MQHVLMVPQNFLRSGLGILFLRRLDDFLKAFFYVKFSIDWSLSRRRDLLLGWNHSRVIEKNRVHFCLQAPWPMDFEGPWFVFSHPFPNCLLGRWVKIKTPGFVTCYDLFQVMVVFIAESPNEIQSKNQTGFFLHICWPMGEPPGGDLLEAQNIINNSLSAWGFSPHLLL